VNTNDYLIAGIQTMSNQDSTRAAYFSKTANAN